MAIGRLAYVTRELVKRAASVNGPDRNAQVDRLIQDKSREFEDATRTWFVPRIYSDRAAVPALSLHYPRSLRVVAPGDLLSLATFQLLANDVPTVTIPSTKYVLARQGQRLPYSYIVTDPSAITDGSSYDPDVATGFDPHFFIDGVWGYSARTSAAGSLVGTINDSVTALVCSDASLIGVGDVLLIGTEQLLVADRSSYDTTAVLSSGVNEQVSTRAVTLAAGGGANVHQGEIITIDAERMYIESVNGDVLIVDRQYDGSTNASHLANAKLYADRTLTVVRAQGRKTDDTGGTTAASHSAAAAIAVYVPPDPVRNAVLAKVIGALEQEQAGYGRVVGTGEGQRPYSGKDVADVWHCAVREYRRNWVVV